MLTHILFKFESFDSLIILIFGSVPDFLTKILPLFLIIYAIAVIFNIGQMNMSVPDPSQLFVVCKLPS